MKFWLTCFVLLFAGAELFEWIVKIGAEGLSGAWLVLGGMALAAVSNAKHLPRLNAEASLSSHQSISSDSMPSEAGTSDGSTAATVKAPPSTTETAEEDTISFKVRLPWR